MNDKSVYAPNKIKEIRKTKNMTLVELADAANTTHSTVQKLESSEMGLTLDWMIRLAKALNCHPMELVEWDFPIPAKTETEKDSALLSIIETIINAAFTTEELPDKRAEMIEAAYQVAQKHLKGGISPLNAKFMADLRQELMKFLP